VVLAIENCGDAFGAAPLSLFPPTIQDSHLASKFAKQLAALNLFNTLHFMQHFFEPPAHICLRAAKRRMDKGAQMAQREMSANLLSVGEAEAQTGVSRWTWRRWAYDGKVASVKLGRRLLIPAAEIDRLVAENTRPRLAEARK
jgi:excisionase family DNA binding protein